MCQELAPEYNSDIVDMEIMSYSLLSKLDIWTVWSRKDVNRFKIIKRKFACQTKSSGESSYMLWINISKMILIIDN